LQQLRSQADDFLSGETASISRLLDDLGVMLFETVYGSPEASAYKRLYFDEQLKRFQELVDRRGIGFFCRNEHMLLQRVKQAKENDFGEIPQPEPMPKPFIRVRMLPNEYVNRSRCVWLEEEDRLRVLSGAAKVRYLVTPVPFRENFGSILDVYLHDGATWADKSGAAYSVLLYLRDCYKEFCNVEGMYEFCTEQACRGVFVTLLGHLLGAAYKIRIEEATSPLDYPIFALYGPKDWRKWTRTVASETRKSSLLPDRRWELSCLKAVLDREKKGIVLVSAGTIKVYDESWRGTAELDGVFLTLLKRSMHITVIEAKRRVHRSSRRALNQLQQSLARLGVDSNSRHVKYWRGRGLAYARAKLPLPLVQRHAA
jgi:hypothetical protein